MATFDRLANLPLTIEGYELEGKEFTTTGFERLSTVIQIKGEGEEGVGEDVTYDTVDHVALQDAGTPLDLTGHATLGEFCEFMGDVDTFPEVPQREVSRRYRRWAFESAALDLALRQGGIGIAEARGPEARPVTFVSSMRLSPGEGEPSSIETLRRKLDRYPDLRFKLDPTNDWTDELIAALVATGAVDSLDLKGFYKGTPVDVVTDPELYSKLIESFPATVWFEDPDVTEQTKPVLDPVADRITWDAPIHAISDIEDRPWQPKMVNIKPSRVGGLEDLCDTYDYCDAQGIGAYGGGQWELDVGRGQIQVLASLFHPDTPNDTAPRPYNEAEPPPGLPTSPMPPRLSPTGFRWE
jgi:hypothetical protein